MNDPAPPPSGSGHDEMMSALFAHLVMQHANLALMYLGQTPHPQTGKPVVDLESARMFIDLLEMLEVKTRGNLGPEEANLLRQSLASARMAFVEAVDQAPAPGPAQTSMPADASGPTPAPPTPSDSGTAPEPESPAHPEDEDRRRFTKKY